MISAFQSHRVLPLIGIFSSMIILLIEGANLARADFITPSGLPPGSQYQIIFVTADVRVATSADIGVYNSFVSDQAHLNTKLPTGLIWKAVASTAPTVLTPAGTDAKDNADTYDNVPIYNTKGQLIADGIVDGKLDLWDGSIYNVIYDQYGEGTGDSIVWTGSEWDGTKTHNYGPFVGPLGSSSPYISYGTSTFTDERWLDHGALRFPSEAHSFYALSEQITIIPEPGTSTLLCMGAAFFAIYSVLFAFPLPRTSCAPHARFMRIACIWIFPNK
jgi:hypothetical protein